VRINHVWSLDFLADAFIAGKRFRILAVMDQYSRCSLSLLADTSITGEARGA
jgi:putative transposase